MYLMLGRAEPLPRVTTETPAPFSPMALTRILDPKTREFGFVCRIYTKLRGGHSVGSGVLIMPRYVLTCAHVIQPPENPNVESITVHVAQNGPADGKHGIKADGWAVRPGWVANCCRSWDEDYGIIRLSKPATGFWPVAPFNPRRLMGKGAYLAGYPVRTGDPDAHFMYQSRGLIAGTIRIDSCVGHQFPEKEILSPIDEVTRLVAHRLDTAKSISGGPMWSFVDGQRVLWGLHAGRVDNEMRKAVLLNARVRRQIATWIRRDLPTRT
jgi:V8-like Glu-specific endopeptidase